MSTSTDQYESIFRDFDSPWMRQLRREAYGEDIGQHSWVTAAELRADIRRLGLTPKTRLLDLGCGPCGPLTFILREVGCVGVGVDFSSAGLRVGHARASELGVDHLLTAIEGDLNEPLPFESHMFDAVISLDVILHVRDRAKFLREIVRVLRPAGKFLLTDAGIITGPLSNEDVRGRSPHGFSQFVPGDWNEAAIASAGLRLLETEDRTMSAVKNASGRRTALLSRRPEWEQRLGAAAFQNQLDYLATVIDVSQRRALSRIMFLAENR